MNPEISGDEFVNAQTRQIEEEFKCSRPRPRNRAMGFKDEKKRKRRRIRLNEFGEIELVE